MLWEMIIAIIPIRRLAFPTKARNLKIKVRQDIFILGHIKKTGGALIVALEPTVKCKKPKHNYSLIHLQTDFAMNVGIPARMSKSIARCVNRRTPFIHP